jgi:hypothetical protein
VTDEYIKNYQASNPRGDDGSSSDLDNATSWSQAQWSSWFSSHPYSNPSNQQAVSNFASANSSWIGANYWWNSLFSTWTTGAGSGYGELVDDSLDNATSWNQAQWTSWFNTHSAYDSSNVYAVADFQSANYLWVNNNSWWTSLYTTWATGATISW